MKIAIALLFIILLLTGCNPDSCLIYEETVSIKENTDMQNNTETNPIDLLKNYPNLDENIKTHLRELYMLWRKFDESKVQDKDPTYDFHNSEYITKLKDFLSQRESIAVSGNDLKWILEQNDLEAMDKVIILSKGKEYNIRVISYNVNYYVQAITDFVGLQNKWAFIQCWNEDEFYFTTLSDGNIHTVHDFFPLEVNGVLHIILTGTSFSHYPKPPFLWAWHLETDGFKQSSLFNFDAVETDEYFIYDNVDFNNNHCRLKWTVQTDGAFMSLEKSELYEWDSWPDYFNIHCEVKNDGKIFIFTSIGNIGEIDDTIQISMVNGRFIIE